MGAIEGSGAEDSDKNCYVHNMVTQVCIKIITSLSIHYLNTKCF